MHQIIPIFVSHGGCPNRCVFCNQNKTLGIQPERITEVFFEQTVLVHLSTMEQNGKQRQIAFYGGNFTGMDEVYQIKLLEMANAFIRKNLIHSVRISTRPDYIDAARIDFLKSLHVASVEIGAQSLDDAVLLLANREHSSDDVTKAIKALRAKGMETGLHLMVGLPGDNPRRFSSTIEKTIKLRPDAVRIHPTIVFQDTALALAYFQGTYKPLSMPDAIDYCKYAVLKLEKAHIPVIRLGLQTTPEMEKPDTILAGPYHPAFGALVQEAIFLDMALKLLAIAQFRKEIAFHVSTKDESNLRGHGNNNIKKIKEIFDLGKIDIHNNKNQERGSLILTADGRTSKTKRVDLELLLNF
jgi:histone acetyltransferase (RNA polymerase elongator complex component)